MKKLYFVFLAFVLTLSFVLQVSASDIKANTLDKQITQLQSEISKLQQEKKTLGAGLNVIMGTVMSQKPYTLKDCSGVGDACAKALLNGVKYFVIKNPEDGEINNGYFYGGTHRYMGTTTVTVNNKKYTAYVFGKVPNLKRWREVGDILEQKTAKLDELKRQKEIANVNLSRYIYTEEDDVANMVMQIGNTKMCTPDGKIEPIDSSNKVYPTDTERIMIPIEPIVKTYGGKTTYDTVNKKYIIILNKMTFEIAANSSKAIMEYKGEIKTITMDGPVKQMNTKLLVSYNFINDIPGMYADWIDRVKVIRIAYEDPDRAQTELDNSISVTNSGEYILNYEPYGLHMTYDKSWGSPVFDDSNYSPDSDEDLSKIVFETTKFGIWISNDQTPDESDYNMSYEGNEEIPLTTDNSGIKAMYIDKVKQGGTVRVIGENGSITTINYMATIDNEDELAEVVKDLNNQIMKSVKTVSKFGASG